jgi:hypothetical protein
MILGKEGSIHSGDAGTIQFGMLHILIYKTDIVPVILCGVKFGVLHQEKNRD